MLMLMRMMKLIILNDFMNDANNDCDELFYLQGWKWRSRWRWLPVIHLHILWNSDWSTIIINHYNFSSKISKKTGYGILTLHNQSLNCHFVDNIFSIFDLSNSNSPLSSISQIAKLSGSQIKSWVALYLLVVCLFVRPSVWIGNICTYLNCMTF